MSGYTAIKADHIFSAFTDFTAKRYLLLKDGIIENISDSLPVHQGMRHLDFTGFVVSPFFCDYHLHFSHDALASSGGIAETLLQYGIKRVYEGGDSDLSGIEMKNLLRESLDIRTSGYALYRQGTYGRYIGKGVDGFNGARDLMDQLYKKRVDYIKLINSGLFRPETGGITAGGFEKKDVAEIVKYAKDKGLDVICHANGDKAVREAVCAGVSAIVHGLYVSEETLSMMYEKRVSFIPTVNAFASLSMKNIDGEAKANIESAVEGHLLAISKAADIGLKVLPGSDSGPRFLPYGKSFLDELVFFKKAGLSEDCILASAAAETLKKGMQADFLVMKGMEIEKLFVYGTCIKGCSLS